MTAPGPEEALRRWTEAITGLRACLRTVDGAWLVDALEWQVVGSLAQQTRHRHGPVPPPATLAGVFAALDEQVPASALTEVADADAQLLATAPWPHGRADAAAFRARSEARLPRLRRVRELADHPAHRRAREILQVVRADLERAGVRMWTADALASVRWWPGRAYPRHQALLVDPLGINFRYRLLTDARRPAVEWEGALRSAESVATGRGLPAFQPEAWILAALRFRAKVVDRLWL